MINEKQLNEFKQIYKKHFWIELSNKEALEKSIALVISVKNALFVDFDNHNKKK